MLQPRKKQPVKVWKSADPETGANTRGRDDYCEAADRCCLERQQSPPKTPPKAINLRRCRFERSPQERPTVASDQPDLGRAAALSEDTKPPRTNHSAASLEAVEVASRSAIGELSLDDRSDSSVDQDSIVKRSFVQLGELGKMAFQVTRSSQLTAAAGLKTIVLPNPGGPGPWGADFNFCSTQDEGRVHFAGNVGLTNHIDAEQEACRFVAIIASVLLTKKANLQSSQQGYNLDAFLCAIAELLPQLGAFADMMDEVSEPKELGTKRVWSLLMWIMEETVTVEFGTAPLRLSETGIVALEKLDEFAQNVLVLLVSSPPTTFDEHPVYVRFHNKNWLSEDYQRLRGFAAMADYYGGGLDKGYYLEETMREMKQQREKLAARPSR